METTHASNVRLLVETELVYSKYNAEKTLSATEASAFECQRFEGLDVTRDEGRADPYYNRIVRLPADTPPTALQRALDFLDERSARVEVPLTSTSMVTSGAHRKILQSCGFSRSDDVAWWVAQRRTPEDAASDADASSSVLVEEISRERHAALRSLFETDGPIESATWEQKIDATFDPQMRWFGVFDAEQLVAAASIWTHERASILGSAMTRQSHRRRGIQRLLLDARRRCGAETHFVDVEPDSTSERNCSRAGFAPFERRQVWTREVSA